MSFTPSAIVSSSSTTRMRFVWVSLRVVVGKVVMARGLRFGALDGPIITFGSSAVAKTERGKLSAGTRPVYTPGGLEVPGDGPDGAARAEKALRPWRNHRLPAPVAAAAYATS